MPTPSPPRQVRAETAMVVPTVWGVGRGIGVGVGGMVCRCADTRGGAATDDSGVSTWTACPFSVPCDRRMGRLPSRASGLPPAATATSAGGLPPTDGPSAAAAAWLPTPGLRRLPTSRGSRAAAGQRRVRHRPFRAAGLPTAAAAARLPTATAAAGLQPGLRSSSPPARLPASAAAGPRLPTAAAAGRSWLRTGAVRSHATSAAGRALPWCRRLAPAAAADDASAAR